ncbi:MAG: RagB/SusD family nutrient uptake outer membrane protein [Prevotella sp.]|nr:RagB/SusD family nutrient uptake outer membrane protein [Prevotella sp.]
MKQYIVKITSAVTLGISITAGSFLTSCSEDFLKPDPLSFFEPKTTFNTESGLQAALAMADRHLRLYWTNYEKNNINVPISTEYMFSELSVYGKTDQGGGIWDDVNGKLTPMGGMQSNDTNHMMYFWDQTYTGIKYANTVLSNIDNVSSLSEELKNEYKGRAYFHRAFRYYSLVWQFGNVPLITKILEVPKQNYRSTTKEAIIQMCIEDMKKAVEWVPAQKDMVYYGMVNKEACRMLLAKLYLSAGEWKLAEEQCNELINNSGLALMKQPFGDASAANSGEPKTWNVTRNVIWDLHRPENKLIKANTETIMGLPNTSEQTHTDFLTMRIFGPYWSDDRLKMPDGERAVINYARNAKEYNQELDWLRVAGRGIGTVRLTYFAQHTLWNVNGVEDTDDYRHNSTVGNWMRMEDMKCNNPKSRYYGQNIMFNKPEDGSVLTNDTIRDWYDFPLYKIYLKDAVAEANQGANQFNGGTKGSNVNWYLYRLAEAYLVRAEARLYQKDVTGATSDVNELRKRANCSQLYTTVNIGDIANERARELYLEEWRNVELTRISYDLAKSGIADEWGNTYSLDNWDKQEGTDAQGGSYWYQRIMHYSYYNRGYTLASGKATLNYTMNKYNVFWPIPDGAITSNKDGQLWQNYGYSGYDADIAMWENWQDAVADEDKVN